MYSAAAAAAVQLASGEAPGLDALVTPIFIFLPPKKHIQKQLKTTIIQKKKKRLVYHRASDSYMGLLVSKEQTHVALLPSTP